jgi:hypothetical protein
MTDTAGRPAAAHDYAEAQLPRIESMIGADPGVFALACDAFLEGLAVHMGAPWGEGVSFRDKLEHLEGVLDLRGPSRNQLHALAKQFGEFRRHTNDVRHRFIELDVDEVIAVQERFRSFLSTAGFSHPVITRLAELVNDAWSDHTPKSEYRGRLKALQIAANTARAENATLLEKIAAWEADQAAYDEAVAETKRLQAHIASLEQQKGADRSRITELRQEIFDATERARHAAAQLDDQNGIRAYVDYISRATTLTRTRSDYERSVLTLSPEQEQIVAAVGEHGDFLVKGPAGTGKTLVLMHAVQQERERIRSELGFDDHTQLGIFTFNKSLARFNRYLATIIGSDVTDLTIQHADALIADLLAADDRELIFGKPVAEIYAKVEQTALPEDQFVVEAEEFILGNDLTREQYVDEVIPRRGLKKPLHKEDRAEVWDACETAWRIMDEQGTISTQRAVQLLLRKIESDDALREKLSFRRIFLDEAQDLTALQIKFFAAIGRRGTVICGDEQQRLYRFGGSFLRSGVDIRNRSKTLETNFRNTVEICALSERYREQVPGLDRTALGTGSAFRHGPEPEFFVLPDSDMMWDAFLARLHFFLGRLGYAPENIAVLAPFKNFLKKATRLIEEEGLETCSVLDDEFDFQTSTGVRLSTMHSAKGLEFPVVFLLLPMVAGSGAIDEEEAEARMRNLVYVSLTRAMDNLQVFATQDGVEKNPVVGEVVVAMSRQTEPRETDRELRDIPEKIGVGS